MSGEHADALTVVLAEREQLSLLYRFGHSHHCKLLYGGKDICLCPGVDGRVLFVHVGLQVLITAAEEVHWHCRRGNGGCGFEYRPFPGECLPVVLVDATLHFRRV